MIKYLILFSIMYGIIMPLFSQEIKFVGYQDDDPVFAVTNEEGVSLLQLNDGTGKTREISSSTGLKDVISYAQGSYIGFDEYGSVIYLSAAEEIPLRFQEDFSDESDFTDRIYDRNKRLGQQSVILSRDGRQVVYPQYDRLTVMSKDPLDNTVKSVDYSYLNEERGSVVVMGEAAEHYYLLVSFMAPYQLYQVAKEGEEYKLAPFTLGRRGGFGIKFNPAGNEVAFIYDDLPVLYRFDLDRFQIIRSSELPTGKKLEQQFKGVYYSPDRKEWLVANMTNGELRSYSLGAGKERSSYGLTLDQLEEEVAKERLKNQSAMDELRTVLKKYNPKKGPFTRAQKQEIEKTLDKFQKKYRFKTSEDPMTERAVGTVNMLLLDTAFVSEKRVLQTEQELISAVKEDKLNFQPLLGAQLIGAFGTDQSPVHEPRVRVLKALVEDYLSENEINSNEALQSSGLGLLILAYKSNENYDEALMWHQKFMDYLNKDGINYSMKEVYEERVYLLLDNENYKEALETIETYQSKFVNPEDNYINTAVQAKVMKVSALGGLKQYKEAFSLIEDLKRTLEEEGERLFGSNTKTWMKFSLLFAEAEIHFEKNQKKGKEKISELVDYIASMKEGFQYRNMYAATKKLLKETDMMSQLERLPDPAR